MTCVNSKQEWILQFRLFYNCYYTLIVVRRLFSLAMENLKGLELLFLLTRDQFTCREDCLVAVFHCLMINDGKKCVGAGDEWPEASLDEGTEALPAGWNSNHDVYSLRYLSESPPGRYLLKIVRAGQSLLINVLDVNAEKAGGISVNVTNNVAENYTDFKTAYVNLADVSRNFRKEVLNQFVGQESTSGARCPGSSEKTDKSQQSEKIRNPVPRPTIPERMRHDEPGFPSVGRGDLNPFAGGIGGGMLADPSSLRFPPRPGGPGYGGFDPHGIPRGSVPPGARFDPIGPSGLGRGFARPDPDHLPPPGYDDMFM